MDFLTIAYQMLSLFIIMLVGYVAFKIKILDNLTTKKLTSLVMNITLPSQIIIAFLNSVGEISNFTVFKVLALSFLCYLIFAAIIIIFIIAARIPKEDSGMYAYMLLFANVGFLGYPVIQAIFGQVAIIYAVVANIAFNILAYSVGVVFISNKTSSKFNLKLMLNPPMISVVISSILFLLNARLPIFLSSSLNYLSNTTTPLAMIILGATIAQIPINEMFDEWKIYVFTLLRLIVAPVAVFSVMKTLNITDPLILGTLVILAGMPVATNATMMSIQYGGNSKLASQGVFFTTILSMITIPLIAIVL